MPPQISNYSLITPPARHCPSISAEIRENKSSLHRKFKSSRRMAFNLRRLVPVLVFLLVSISLLRFVRILVTTSSNLIHSTFPQPPRVPCPFLSACNASVKAYAPLTTPTPRTSLTAKEFKLLADLVKQKAPCNLLIFGLNDQYLTLSSLNEGGMTMVLEDDPNKLRSKFASSNTTRIFKVQHAVPSKRAYHLLRHARQDRSCLPGSSELKSSKCILALRDFPRDVYRVRWDVIVVDGPQGDTPEAPGRMASIYTASMLARAGNSSTYVAVHDVDRTIEKWFSLDFLCEENLVSSKGKLWNFRIQGKADSTSFCVSQIVQSNSQTTQG
ncbi:hypothetical protein MLD38_021909 [Melastoma candidum]|uniref:Uncharacterized protein n=1 Tax=Melastoma candidum TaxID=119954 RepID=A0ACB9QKI2_9MYRT|nr:hypothetical protein MLD38_021909 [Melastoma candidum]